MLVNGPSKFVVQLPRDDGHCYRTQSDDARDRYEIRSLVCPHAWFDHVQSAKRGHRFLNLIHLHRRIDKKANIVKTESNDLNGVFQAKSVVDQDQLVHKSENV